MADTTNSYDSAVHAVHVNDSMHRTSGAYMARIKVRRICAFIYRERECAHHWEHVHHLPWKALCTWFLDATGRADGACGSAGHVMTVWPALTVWVDGYRLTRMTAYKKGILGVRPVGRVRRMTMTACDALSAHWRRERLMSHVSVYKKGGRDAH